MFPSNGSMTGCPPSLHRLPPGGVRRLRRYYEGTPTPAVRPAPLRCSRGRTIAASPVRSHRAETRAWRAWGLRVRPPRGRRVCRWRAAGLSGSWATLLCVRPDLGPRQDRGRLARSGVPTRPTRSL